MRILIADDDPVTRRFISSLLVDAGYETMTAEDGAHALELAANHHFDLIVTDLLMPYQDGYSVLKAIRANERLAHLPVIIVSMLDREQDIVRGLEEGADDYVVKPFNARELLARIKKQLDRVRDGR